MDRSEVFSVDHYTLDLVDSWRRVTEPAQVFGDLTKVMSHFGFSSVIVTGLPVPHESLEPMVLAHRWPDGWWERYHSQNYIDIDPTVARVRSTEDAFRWGSTRSPKLHRKQLRVLDEASEFGLGDGFCVPIPLLNGFEAVVSLGTEKYMLSEREEAALQVIGISAYHAIRRRSRPNPDSEGKPILSRREIECVKWTAAGKSAWEIGEILNLTESTVNTYLHTAQRKMNARGKAYLVAQCLRAGLIH
jgi:LuxR family transcriptional regulator, quorum-sensing system regulator BjaR1